MSALRVVVASDAIGDLDSRAAGVALASGWVAAGEVMVAVVPLAEGGEPLAEALSGLVDGQVQRSDGRWRVDTADTLAVGLHPGGGSGEEVGAWLGAVLSSRPSPPGRIIIDLTAITAGQGGRGLLAALSAHRRLLAGADLIGVVRADERDLPLLGLRGAVARRGYEAKLDPAEVLRAEGSMGEWLAHVGQPDLPGAGAAGGGGAAVLALGGRLAGGVDLCAEIAGLASTVGAAEVVVTGCTDFHVGNRGGPIVGFVAGLAESSQRPCLVFAVESSLSRREMRTFGVEAAYAISAPFADPPGVSAAARRVARGWLGARRQTT